MQLCCMCGVGRQPSLALTSVTCSCRPSLCLAGRRFYPERLRVHLRFFCGPHAKKSDALAKQQKKKRWGQSMSQIRSMMATSGEARLIPYPCLW